MRNKQQLGFTLIEVVVASTILALLMGGFHQIMAVGFSTWEKGQKAIDSQQNVRLAVSQISREIRTAQCWDIGESGPSNFPNNIITLEIPELGNPDNYRTISYYLSKGQILRNVNGSGHNVVAYGIKSMEFACDPQQNNINITISCESGFTIATKAFLRVSKDSNT